MNIGDLLTRDAFSKFLGNKIDRYRIDEFTSRVVVESKGFFYTAEEDISEDDVFIVTKYDNYDDCESQENYLQKTKHSKHSLLMIVDILPDKRILSEIYDLQVLTVEYLAGHDATALFPSDLMDNAIRVQFKNEIQCVIGAEKLAEKMGVWAAAQGFSIVVAYGDPVQMATLYDSDANEIRKTLSRKASNAIFMVAKHIIKLRSKKGFA